MTQQIKPMLAVNAPDLHDLRYPLWASPKLDGIRAIINDGVVMSRNWKPIPNRRVQKVLGLVEASGLDGELIVGPLTDKKVFNTTSSAIMSRSGEPDFVFWVFDCVSCKDKNWAARIEYAADLIRGLPEEVQRYVKMLDHTRADSPQMARDLEEIFLEAGYEGMMLREEAAPYKFGRSTLKQQALLKVKRFLDAEATITGWEELMHNLNDAEVGELGQTTRSHSKEGLVGGNTLGALTVAGLGGTFDGVAFNIGTGFDAETRQELWNRRHELVGAIVKFKYFEVGSLDAPRFPVFLGFRDINDL